ncbi:GtrA-like protein [Synechococcus sp. PCC 7335]|uniref:GtrA family protein n=1 Tax=Synechococcus sp. (strain ATCC 29403 / PCC 7335) TaxID=91464 RepID=UPI00017EE3F5|nr:GtrA family protein [Synechococcus sp. PCC 7335]EDX83737.1 GtrA-like protein [Synechococcus sp. PCC 7335]
MRYLQKLQQFPLGRLLQFGIVGFSGVFVDLIVFYLLRTEIGMTRSLSILLSIEAAIINNFFWNDAWTFADIAQQQKGWPARLQRFLKFHSVCLIGAVLQYLLIEGFLLLPFAQQIPALVSQVAVGKWASAADEYVAKVIAITLVTLWNFWLNLRLSWRSRS